MEWNELYKGDHQPGYPDIDNYIGGEGKKLWAELIDYMQKSYNLKPKMSYSKCAEKPGWNVKFQKSGVSFGTLYPEENGFSVFLVIGYKLDLAMEMIKGDLSPEMREKYEQAPDYMKIGKWMMFRIDTEKTLTDYKLLMSVKSAPVK